MATASEEVTIIVSGLEQKRKDIEAKLNKQVAEANKVLAELNNKEIKNEISAIRKSISDLAALKKSMISLSRSVIKLTLHYKSQSSEKRSKFLGGLSEKLYEKGFVLSPDQVLSLEADRTEIIYYSPITKSAANEIKDVLKKSFPSIKSKFESSDISDAPNRIIIKLSSDS